jgi:hypothetical protein
MNAPTKDISIKIFTQSFRRVLYLQTLLKYNIEDLKRLSVTPSVIKDNAHRLLNAINYSQSDMMCRTTPANWDAVRSDLNSDQLHDISLFLDTIADIKNIEDIRQVIEEHKLLAA